ncbi:MAG: DUF5348 domain-containing protein [Nitrospirales bacterium]|nr:DUF5348 domain-containing protein [Nitrospirales bacterium]
MKTQGKLLYCNETDRWQIHEAYDKPISLHCGECFEIEVEKTYLSCRIEWDSEWYVIFSSARFRLHPRTNYRVRGI